MKAKKAELTTQQIVVLIILLISFIVIMFLIFRLNLGETTTKQICHNSVVLKAQSDGLVGSLDCKTNYICVSGGEGCRGGVDETIDVDVSDKEEIFSVIADEMADCWWMFGEGEINYVGGVLGKGTHCAICSIIYFDEKVQTLDLTYKELYDYLAETEKSNGDSYLVYLYERVDSNYVLYELGISPEKQIDLDETYAVITGRNKDYIGKDDIVPSLFVVSRNLDETPCTDFDITMA